MVFIRMYAQIWAGPQLLPKAISDGYSLPTALNGVQHYRNDISCTRLNMLLRHLLKRMAQNNSMVC